MSLDLEAELARTYQPLPPPPDGMVAAKKRGDHRRRARWGALAATAAVLATGSAAGPLVLAGHHATVRVQVGSNPGTTTPATTPPTATPPTATPPTAAAPVVSAGPSTLVAHLGNEAVDLVDSHTGQVIRQLATEPPSAGYFGTLSPDGSTFYITAPGQVAEPTCPAGCAIDVATGTTTPLPPFRWGNVTPSQLGIPISPDGTREATTTTSGSTSTVTIATTTGNPVTYAMPAGDVALPGLLWSSNGDYLYVGDDTDGDDPGTKESSDPVIMNTATGAFTTLIVPTGCLFNPLALSDTELFANETCQATGVDGLARFRLATGAAETSLAYPAGTNANSLTALGTDPTGEHLIASILESPAGSGQVQVWTEQDGTWARLPGIEAQGVAW